MLDGEEIPGYFIASNSHSTYLGIDGDLREIRASEIESVEIDDREIPAEATSDPGLVEQAIDEIGGDDPPSPPRE